MHLYKLRLIGKSAFLKLRLHIFHIDINKGIESHIDILGLLGKKDMLILESILLCIESSLDVSFALSRPVGVIAGNFPFPAFVTFTVVFINCHCFHLP